MQRISFWGYIAAKQSWMMGLQIVYEKFEGGRSWLIVLHHHRRNPRRLMTLFKPRVRTIQEQKHLFYIYSFSD